MFTILTVLLICFIHTMVIGFMVLHEEHFKLLAKKFKEFIETIRRGS